MQSHLDTDLDALTNTPTGGDSRTIGLEHLRALCRQHGLSLPQGARRAIGRQLAPLPWRKHLHSLSFEDQARLHDSTVLLAGAGGLGGYALELLARFGVGHIRVADGDRFEESNLNRQLLASVDSLGQNKARTGAHRASMTAPLVQVDALEYFLDADNVPAVLQGAHLVVDALGGIAPRHILHEAASRTRLPVISAAVAGWTALVGSELPEQPGISSLWADPEARDAEETLGSLGPVVCLAASLQVAEAVHYLTTGALRLAGKMLCADLNDFSFALYDLR